jgi:methylated-DNA-[protein]-cysteine S-methyltransferase
MVLGAAGGELCLCDWAEKPCAGRNAQRLKKLLNADFKEESTPLLERTKAELDEYFAGRRKAFDIPLHPVGTPFQMRVWSALSEIPYGQTRTYMEIAQRVGNPRGVRAVAQAIGANGIGIIIPCHRVIGSDHSLTGFAGGLDAKRILLQTESSATVAGPSAPRQARGPQARDRDGR